MRGHERGTASAGRAPSPHGDVVLDLAARDAPPGGDVQASISVGGDLNGQVAVGTNIVQVRIDTVHGNVVQVGPPEQPQIRRRATPLRLLPRPARGFLDRGDETAALLTAVAGGEPIGVHGPHGAGKSSLLRHVAHHPDLEHARGGVAHLSTLGETLPDLAQSLFDVFYETDVPYKPSAGALRAALEAVDAVLLLDDVGLDPGEAVTLVDLVPGCGVALASTTPLLEPSVELAGLPARHAAALVVAALPEAAGEPDAVAALVASTDRRPLALCQVAAPVAAGQRALTDAVASPEPGPSAAAAASTPERELATVLAAVPGLLLERAQLADVAPLADVGELLDGAEARGLVQRVAGRAGQGERYRLADGVADFVAEPGVLDSARTRVYRYMQAWAEAHHGRTDLPGGAVDAATCVLHDAAVRARWDVVLPIARTLEPALALDGRWDAWAGVLDALRAAAVGTGDEAERAFALHQLGTRALGIGESGAAAALLAEALDIREALGDAAGAAVSAHNLRLLRPRLAWWQRVPASAGIVVAVAVLAAALLWGAQALGVFERPETTIEPVSVPDVTGRTLAEAAASLREAGLAHDVVGFEARADLPAEVVVHQAPEPGRLVAPGATISLTVSEPTGSAPTVPPATSPPATSPPAVAVPDVVGVSLERARTLLDAANLQADVVPQQTEDVDPGTVLAQDPAAGAQVPQGSAVTLTVAESGFVEVPDLHGLRLPEAVERLEAVGLSADPQGDFDGAEDEVRDQAPEPGSTVARGSTVTLWPFDRVQ